MTVWILSFLVALETAGVEHQFTDRHFYTRVGCEAVAHTANLWAEAQKADPGAYATCIKYEAADEM